MAAASPASASGRPLWPLVRLFDAFLRTRLGAQVGKLLAWLIALGYGVALPFAARAPSGDSSDVVVVSAVRWLTWTATAAIALSAAGGGSDLTPARDLAVSRGYSRRAMGLAELLSSGWRTLRVVGVPAMALALLSLAFARSPALLGARALLVVGVLGYVSLVAVLVAVLVNVSRALGPERPRSALLALVVLPHVLHEIFPRVPSVPALTGFLGAALLRLGADLR